MTSSSVLDGIVYVVLGQGTLLRLAMNYKLRGYWLPRNAV